MSHEADKKEVKLYTEKQIEVATFFGGVLPAGILFYKNFMRLGKELQAYLSLVISLSLISLLIFISAFVEDSVIHKIPNYFFNLIWLLLVYFVYRLYLLKYVQKAFGQGATKGSNWSVAGLTLAGLIVTVSIAFAYSFFIPEFKGEHHAYGPNRLFHDSSVTQAELDIISERLYAMEYFDDQGYDARIIKKEDHFELSLLYLASYWNDDSFMTYFEDMALLMEGYLNQKVVIVLRDYNARGNLITKRIND